MAGIKKFEDLLVWKKAHELVLRTYRITEKFPKHELFAMTSQLRRASASVAANIVEGFKRKGIRDSLNFYNTAEASLEEVKYFFLLARDLKYINTIEYSESILLSEEVGKLLFRWIQSQNRYT
ncbi:MAG: four helix bundle protein [Candidatus Magasanikbacteria bacterium]